MIFLVIIFNGCTKNDVPEEVSMPQAEIVTLNISGCKGGGHEEQEIIEVTNNGETLTLKHQNALFTCCISQINTKLDIKNGELKIFESSGEDRCNCVCAFDIKIEIKADSSLPSRITVYRNNLKIGTLKTPLKNHLIAKAD